MKRAKSKPARQRPARTSFRFSDHGQGAGHTSRQLEHVLRAHTAHVHHFPPRQLPKGSRAVLYNATACLPQANQIPLQWTTPLGVFLPCIRFAVPIINLISASCCRNSDCAILTCRPARKPDMPCCGTRSFQTQQSIARCKKVLNQPVFHNSRMSMRHNRPRPNSEYHDGGTVFVGTGVNTIGCNRCG